MRFFYVFALALLLAPGCKKGEPSAAYSEARASFNALYGKHLEAAYLSEDMRAVETQLESVPQDSSDFDDAQELLKRIRSGRERAQADIDERSAAVEDALAAKDAPLPSSPANSPTAAPSGEQGPADSGSDAGEDVSQPTVGMPLSEFTRRFGDCFLPANEVQVEGRGKRPAYQLRPTQFCSSRHPGLGSQFVVVEDAKILAIAPHAPEVADAGSAASANTARSDAGGSSDTAPTPAPPGARSPPPDVSPRPAP